MKYYPTIICLIILTTISMKTSAQKKSFDIEGHRGCRGLMPENTIPAFIKAIEIGVNTLELDVVISHDKQIVVSHEPWMNPAICLNIDGTKLNLKKENELNIFQMNYEEIKNYDCGSKYYERFPTQQKLKLYKPLLSAVFDTVKMYCNTHKLPIPDFNIEIKSEVQYDSICTPFPPEYCDLVLKEIEKQSMQNHCILQSFDMRVMKYLHQTHPEIKLSFLSEELSDFNQIKELLAFVPPIFSPDKDKVSRELILACHNNHIKIIPWTINDESEIKKFIEWGVDGIISDYPDRVVKQF